MHLFPWLICYYFYSATLFYIVKGKEKERIGIKMKKRIITALLDGMDAHLGDDTMMRNGCLTLCEFKIPNDVVQSRMCNSIKILYQTYNWITLFSLISAFWIWTSCADTPKRCYWCKSRRLCSTDCYIFTQLTRMPSWWKAKKIPWEPRRNWG